MHILRRLTLALCLLPLPAPGLEVPGPLVGVDWLVQNRDAVVVLDIRPDPRRFTVDGHIPGAAVLGWNQIQAEGREDGVALIGLAPSASCFTALMQRKGVNRADPVVVTGPGRTFLDTTEMARLYWTIKYFGHGQVALLDGGTAQWRRAGQPLSFEPPETGRGDFVAKARPELIVTTEQVAATIREGTAQRVDVRTLGYYLGLFKESYVAAKGHLPGAKLYPYTLALYGKPVRFRPREELKALAEAFHVDLDRPTVVYCNTGVLSAAGWFIFSELLGNERARLYDGSMHAWARLGRPTETMRLNLGEVTGPPTR